MDDLISRQAAIDSLGEEPPVWYEWIDEIAERNQWRRDVAAIKALPSAQPEVITCEYCKYRVRVEGDGHYRRTEYYCGYEYEHCDPYEMTRSANDPNYFCADAIKRRSEK